MQSNKPDQQQEQAQLGVAGLLSGVMTKKQAADLAEDLGKIKEHLYDMDDGSLQHLLDSEIDEELADIVKQDFQQLTSPQDREQVIDQVLQELRELPVLELTLAVKPSETMLEKVAAFVKQQVQTNVLFHVNYDMSLLGGAVVSYQGKYYDGSVKKIFDTVAKEEEVKAMQELAKTSEVEKEESQQSKASEQREQDFDDTDKTELVQK